MVVEKATVPVIETGSGVCHTFIDETADIQKAVLIAENAKLQRPGVCNAMETLLVHKNIASSFLPELVKKFDNRAELRCCSESYQIINALNLMKDDKLKLATEDDFGFEFLDNILAIKVVENIEQAILHINSHNTKHSEAIITQNISNAKKFQSEIDASSVYVNASTRFTDGGVFGFGAELGISTQKFHVRGPMGLTALTTTKYLIDGDGHTR
jgi:glutamate-5-semialdehyde dehydrogenase